MKQDVTAKVEIGEVDGELVPITKCLCGAKFELWTQTLGIGAEWECPKCRRRLGVDISVRVTELA